MSFVVEVRTFCSRVFRLETCNDGLACSLFYRASKWYKVARSLITINSSEHGHTNWVTITMNAGYLKKTNYLELFPLVMTLNCVFMQNMDISCGWPCTFWGYLNPGYVTHLFISRRFISSQAMLVYIMLILKRLITSGCRNVFLTG